MSFHRIDSLITQGWRPWSRQVSGEPDVMPFGLFGKKSGLGPTGTLSQHFLSGIRIFWDPSVTDFSEFWI